MNNNLNEYIKQILNDMEDKGHAKSTDLPNIDLYMDQVLTYMDKNIGIYKRNDEDKILTKTMINNYSKSKLLPPSNKKKYSKDHILLLIMIYSLKQTLSISDIKKLLLPLYEMTSSNDEPTLSRFFDDLMACEFNNYEAFFSEVNETINTVQNLYSNQETGERLNTIALAYLLAAKASVYKHLSGKLIDEFSNSEEEPTRKNKDK